MLWSPAASSDRQRRRVRARVKARRYAPPPLRGAGNLDAGSAHALRVAPCLTMPNHNPYMLWSTTCPVSVSPKRPLTISTPRTRQKPSRLRRCAQQRAVHRRSRDATGGKPATALEQDRLRLQIVSLRWQDVSATERRGQLRVRVRAGAVREWRWPPRADVGGQAPERGVGVARVAPAARRDHGAGGRGEPSGHTRGPSKFLTDECRRLRAQVPRHRG